jgi:hypothetical protein
MQKSEIPALLPRSKIERVHLIDASGMTVDLVAAG